MLARATILATGGMAALWQRTTNPAGAVGAGLSLAHAARAELADLEFMQFHPTALRIDGPRDGFLITEAVRGEGAVLLDERGERFVDELAPRDEVALAIQAQVDTGNENAVTLDMRKVDVGRFPNIAAALAEIGLDPRRDLLPVAPAAHYTMGGVACDLDGRSSLPGLYAVGESACTGMHGANRLASNSLAECFVFGRRAALAACEDPEPPAAAEPDEEIHARPPVSRDPRRAVAPRRIATRCRGPARAVGRPLSARAADRRVVPRARREPRRPSAQRSCRHRSGAGRNAFACRQWRAGALRAMDVGTERLR